jgi:hypothetical protein
MRFFVSGSRSRGLFALGLAVAIVAGLVTPAVAIDITGPNKVEAYRLIDHSAPNPAMWEIEPSAGVDMRQAADGMSITWVAPPGTYRVNAIIVLIDFDKRSWSIQKAAKEVVVSSENPPSPPEPAPLPGAKFQVAFLIESGDLDNLPAAQRAMLASLTLRDDLARRGHHFVGVLERDQANSAPAALAPFYAAVEGDPFPRVAIAPLAGGDVIDKPLPADQAALYQLLGETP